MTWKKILSAFLIGAFMFGVPAVNFDVPFTKTVSAAYRDKDYEKVKENYKKKRAAYERAKKQYAEARRNGEKVKMYRALYEGAKQDYYEARREYERYRR